jgi:hypothetical protein
LKKDEVKEQILKWLSQEQDWKVEVSTDPYYYFTCLVRLSESMGCNICIENHIERVNVIGNAMLSQSDRINYKLSAEKDEFWIDLRMNLIHVGINVAAIPGIESLESIQLTKPIYFDGLSQDKFIDVILRVTDALELAELIFRNFSDAMSQQLHKS